MLKFTRKAFVDHPICAEQLRAAIDLWRLWFEQDRRASETAAERGYVRLEAEVYGFAVFEAEALTGAALQACERRQAVVEQTDCPTRDTLRFIGPWAEADDGGFVESAAAGMWTALMSAPALQGLCFSLTICCRSGARRPTEGGLGGDLTLFGVCRGPDEFLVKTIFRRRRASKMAHLDHYATSHLERVFLDACERFRRRRPSRAPAVGVKVVLGPEWDTLRERTCDPLDAASDDSAAEAVRSQFFPKRGNPLFVTGTTERLASCYTSMIAHLPGERSLGTLVRRVLGCLCAASVLMYLALQPGTSRGAACAAFLFAAISVGLVVKIIAKKARRIAKLRAGLNQALGRLYQRGVSGATAASIRELGDDDPHPRRCGAEWAALGARHCFDFRLNAAEASGNAHAVMQHFVLEADWTYVLVNYMHATRSHQQFPCTVFFMLTTQFTDGTRLSTSNASASGYRKPLKRRVVFRVVVGESDPAVVLERHREVLRRLIAEGRQPIAPIADLSSLSHKVIQDHEETRALVAGRTICSWSDAFRQTFELPRKEYFEPHWPRKARRD